MHKQCSCTPCLLIDGKSASRSRKRAIKAIVVSLLTIAGLLFQAIPGAPVRADNSPSPQHSDNPAAPASTVKLIFIHHSTGENWLADGNGGLGLALGQNNYFVSDTNYGWGPALIGDSTDIPNWLDWFRGSSTPTTMAALYAENSQHSSYTHTLANPGGENTIIMFKSCFPNSALEGNPSDPPSASGWLTVGHAKYVYNQILQYFSAHPEKLFIVITAPPLIDGTYAANARAFNQWLMSNWLSENSYTQQNVAVFDFYNVLTGPNNHHRYYNNQIQHIFTSGSNTEYYPSSGGDDHPSKTGNLKATSEFLPLLNIFYHRWQDSLNNTPTIGGCSIYPANNIWNTPVDTLPVNAHSADWVNSIGRTTGFHMDFGSQMWEGGPIGIPYNIVNGSVPKVTVSFYYPTESDPGPYPIPASPLIEYGSDHHILMVDSSTCTLYEIYDASYSGGRWHGGSGAIWNLASNALRPAGWTSADAAGLPILPGLVRYDEIVSGAIKHAIRFTASNTNGYIWPARHLTSDDPDAPQIPPMGARFRLKSTFAISGYPAELQVILRAMKTYGIILADNGADWYISGAPDGRWNDEMLHQLDVLTGNDFEAVDTSVLMVDPDSGESSLAPVVSITISGNAGESGVTLRYTDGTAKSVTSGSNGRYTITVPYHWSGAITPSKSGLTFSPASRTYPALTANQAGQNYSAVMTVSSTGSYDGYILESTETSGTGDFLDATTTTFILGDDRLNRQYRAILSFNTASLPDTAVLQSAVVKIKQYGSPTGASPFSVLGNLYVDIRKGYFGTSAALQATDFNAAASTSSVAATFGNSPATPWYSATLTSTGRSYINKTSLTQLRLRFSIDDNNNLSANYMRFYSGNYSSSSYRPQLIVIYTLP